MRFYSSKIWHIYIIECYNITNKNVSSTNFYVFNLTAGNGTKPLSNFTINDFSQYYGDNIPHFLYSIPLVIVSEEGVPTIYIFDSIPIYGFETPPDTNYIFVYRYFWLRVY